MAKITRLDYDKVAMILVEAFLFGDKEAANRNGLTIRTIQAYRQRMREDSQLSEIFAQKKLSIEDNWITDIKPTMIAGLDFIRRASQSGDTSPEMVHAIAGAMKIISSIGLTKELIDARIGQSTGYNQLREEN